MAATADTFKFSTVIWIIAGLLIPLWPISLPVCWFLAYRSYKSGTHLADQIAYASSAPISGGGSPVTRPPAQLSVADEIKKLKELHDAGILTDEEFQRKKAEILG